MADLGDDQAAVPLGLVGQLLEGLESLAREGRSARNDGISGGLELIRLEHEIPREEDAEFAGAPVPVHIDEFLGGDAALGVVLGVPRGQALGHGPLRVPRSVAGHVPCRTRTAGATDLHETILGREAAELELQRLP